MDLSICNSKPNSEYIYIKPFAEVLSYGADLIKSLSNQSLHENVSIILRIISNDSLETELEIHLEVTI